MSVGYWLTVGAFFTFFVFTCGSAIIDAIADTCVTYINNRRTKREFKEFLDQL